MEKRRKDILKELKSLSPDFPDVKGKEQFDIPEGYFDKMQKNVLAKVLAENTAEPEVAKVRRLFDTRTIMAIAAVALIVIVAAIVILRPTDQGDIFADISNDEAMEYAMNNIDDFEGLLEEEIAGANIDLNFIDSFNEEDLEAVLDNLIEDLDEETLQSIL